jgi:hypothetical protein
MGYYVRAFCTSSQVPELQETQTWLQKRGSVALIDEPNHAVEQARAQIASTPIINLGSSDWEQVAVTYKRGKLPILAECNREDGSEDSLLHEELAEFVELIEEAEPSAARQRVLDHLGKTKFIVACQVPTSDVDDDGYNATGDFLTFFAERCGGLIRADREGFYEGSTLVLPLDGAA